MATKQPNKIARVKKSKRMTEEDLATLCFREFDDANQYMNEISDDRIDALNSYNQEPYGNEEDGLSGYVSSDVRDAIEWLLPQIIDIFVGGDTPVCFMPENEQDVQAAEAESRFCQYVFERQNAALLITYTWFKDALLQKNGIVCVDWTDNEKLERETYKNKTSAEYSQIQQDDEVEIIELTINVNDTEYSAAEYAEILGSQPEDARQRIDGDATYDFVALRTKGTKQVEVRNVPPENFYVRNDHNSVLLEDCAYSCEIFPTTRGEIMEKGPAEGQSDADFRDMVDNLPSNQTIFLNDEAQVRRRKEGGDLMQNNNAGKDKSRDKIFIYRHFIRADFDHDGVAEMRLVETVGPGGKYVLKNLPVDRNPYHALTPYLNTHKFFGRSLADNLGDIQRAKSQLMRNGFDAFMFSSLPRNFVQGSVNADDLLAMVPGGIVRGEAGSTVTPLVVPFAANEMFTFMQQLDQTRAERSGFSKDSMGLDPSAIANMTNANGAMALAQAQLLAKMIASLFAHTGFRTMMLHIRELVMKNQPSADIIDLTGAPLQTDPRDWRKQRRTDIKVGIGYAGKQEKVATFTQLLTTQQAFMTIQQGPVGPLVNPAGVFATTAEILKSMGIKNPGTYFQDPAQYQPPPPSPTNADIQTKAGVEKINADIKGADADRVLQGQKQSNDFEVKKAELMQNERLENKKLDLQHELAHAELGHKYATLSHTKHQDTVGNLRSAVNAQADSGAPAVDKLPKVKKPAPPSPTGKGGL